MGAVYVYALLLLWVECTGTGRQFASPKQAQAQDDGFVKVGYGCGPWSWCVRNTTLEQHRNGGGVNARRDVPIYLKWTGGGEGWR